jgi:hypothetical protein
VLVLPWAPQSRFSMFNLIPQYSSPKRAAMSLTTESTGDAEAHTTANYETTSTTTLQEIPVTFSYVFQFYAYRM